MDFLRRGSKAPQREAPPEFQWVTIQMEVTRWAITAALSASAIGIWAGVLNINDLTNAVKALSVNDVKQDRVNERQDRDINEIKNGMTRHGTLLEQILATVRENGQSF
jgi:hypothetical protein